MYLSTDTQAVSVDRTVEQSVWEKPSSFFLLEQLRPDVLAIGWFDEG